MKKILIAEDNADLAESLKLALETAGYRVEVAKNGVDAIATQVSFAADILITDIMMPEQDGFETLNAFRKEFPGTRLVVISGAQRFDPQKYLRAAKLAGADATFRKPFAIEALLEKLREF